MTRSEIITYLDGENLQDKLNELYSKWDADKGNNYSIQNISTLESLSSVAVTYSVEPVTLVRTVKEQSMSGKHFVCKSISGKPLNVQSRVQDELDKACAEHNNVQFGCYEFQTSDVERDFHHAYLIYSYED